MDKKIFGIVILTWNNYEDTKDCILSIIKNIYREFFIVVVDNGSNDNCLDLLCRQFQDIHTIRNETNIGVARGYNVGFRYALDKGADYVIMLNNDTVLDNNVLYEINQESQKNEDIGILAPVIYNYYNRDEIWTSGVKKTLFPPRFKMTYKKYYPSLKAIDIEYVIGCCICIKRQVFVDIGFLDETIFFMWEDIEFSHRVKKKYRIVQIPQAKVWHKISQTTNPKSSLFWYMHGQSSTLFFRRSFKKSLIISLWYDIFFIIREFIVKKQVRFLRPFIQGFLSGWYKPLQPIEYYNRRITDE